MYCIVNYLKEKALPLIFGNQAQKMPLKLTLYNFSALDIQGDIISFQKYEGKVVLIVNTASKCGLTHQYEGLEKLYLKYKDQGLVILGFPCNQFANQEPADEFTIKAECLLKYNITFPVFSKIDVNGKEALSVFKWLKDELPGFITNQIKWNFTKFIINREGKPVKRFASVTKPEYLDTYLEKNFFKS